MESNFDSTDIENGIQIRNQILKFNDVHNYKEALISIAEGMNSAIANYNNLPNKDKITFLGVEAFLSRENKGKGKSEPKSNRISFFKEIDSYKNYFEERKIIFNEEEFALSHSTLQRQLKELDEDQKIKIHSKSVNHLANLSFYLTVAKKIKVKVSDIGFLEHIIDDNGNILVSNIESKEYFAYYWRVRNKIGIAKLSLYAHKNDKNHLGEMIYYYSDSSDDRKLFCSEKHENNNFQYITLQNEQSDDKKVIYTSLIISLPVEGKEEKGYLTATYSTVRRVTDELVVGAMVLIRINESNKPELNKLLKDYRNPLKSDFKLEDEVPEKVYYFLKNQSIVIKKRIDHNYLPYETEVESYKKLKRKFQGYGINNFHRTLMLYSFEIKNGGAVECNYENFGSGVRVPVLGNILFCNKYVLAIYFNYSDRNHLYRYVYFLKLPQNEGNQAIEGVVSGIDKDFETPFSGKLLLKPISEPVIKSFNKQETANFFNGLDNEIISYFLSEKENSFSTDALFLRDFGKIPSSFYSPNREKLTGGFELFISGFTKEEPSSEPKKKYSRIFRYNLTINPDLSVELSQNSAICCDGIVEFWDDYLLIRCYDAKSNKIGRKIADGFDGVMLFSLKPQITETDKIHILGSMIKIDDNRIQSLGCIITERHNNIPYASSYYRDMVPVKLEEKTFTFDDFDGEFNNGLLSFLQGTIYRKFTIPKNINRRFEPRKTKNRRLYFYSACNIALRLYKYNSKLKNSESDWIDNFELAKHLRDELKDTIDELYNIGFAPEKFAGKQIDELLLQLNQYKIENENESFKEIIESLKEDCRLLIEEVNNKETFGQEEVLKQIKEKWSYLFH